MGKIKSDNVQQLKDAGVLSDKAIAEMEKTGAVSKRQSVKRFIKPAENKLVQPRLYMRGGKGTTPSKKMEQFLADYEKLLDKYTMTMKLTNNKK